jgi:hypothetical protein
VNTHWRESTQKNRDPSVRQSTSNQSRQRNLDRTTAEGCGQRAEYQRYAHCRRRAICGRLLGTYNIENQSKRPKLHYLELNALSARLASEMAAQSNEPTTATGRGRGCHFLDGGISWGPPQSTQDCSWKKPSVVSRLVDLALGLRL